VSDWRQRLAKAPLVVHFVYFSVAFGLVTWLIGELTGTTSTWRGRLIGDVLFGVLMTAFTAWQRRRDGGPEAQLDTAQALRSGRLPADADPQVWRNRLDRQERTQRRVRWIGPVEFGAFAVLGVWLALSQGVIWWVFAGVFVLIGIGCVVASTRTLRRIYVLRGELLHR
jgi:hypothetical protein